MVKEIDNFRKKYPQYNDISDEKLAYRLEEKYPQYKGLVESVYEEQKPREADVIDKLLPTKIGLPLFGKFVGVPIAEGFGRGPAEFEDGQRNIYGDIFDRLPSAIRSKIRAESQLSPFKNLSEEEQIRSYLGETSEKAIEAFNNPDKALVQSYLKESLEKPIEGDPNDFAKTLIRGYKQDAVALAKDIGTDPIQLLMMSLGINNKKEIVSGVQKSGNVLDEALGSTAKKVKNAPSAVKEGVVSKVRPIAEKMADDYINQNVAPKVNKLFVDKIDDFGTSMQEFSTKKLNMPKDAVSHIANKSPKAIRAIANSLDDNADNIIVMIDKAAEGKELAVRSAYQNAFKNLSDKDVIQVNKTFAVVKSTLRKHGMLDNKGNLTAIADEGSLSPFLRQMRFEYQRMNPAGAARNISTTQTAGINKYMWQDMRNGITKLWGKDRDVYGGELNRVLNALHNDAEKAGLAGIKQARSLAEGRFKHLKLIDKVKQKKLENIYKMTGDEIRDLRAVDKYLGTRAEILSKDLAASRYLKKLDDISLDSQVLGQESLLVKQLKAARNPAEFKRIKSAFEEIVGKSDELDSIFKGIKQHTQAQKVKGLIERIGGTGVAVKGVSLLP